MNSGLTWLAAHRSDVLTVIMVVAVVLNIHAFIQQRRTLVELRRLLLWVRKGTLERRRPLMLNGVGHRYSVMPRIIGSELDDD